MKDVETVGLFNRYGAPISSATKLLIAIGAILAVVVAFVIWTVAQPKTGENQQSVCAVVVDRTGSSADPKTIESYTSRAAKTIEGCRKLKSKMVLYYFDNATAKAVLVSKTPYKLFEGKTHTESLRAEDLKKTENAAKAAVGRLFAVKLPKGSRGSDILTSISLVADDLQSQASADKVNDKYLVVLTDGYQSAATVSVGGAFKKNKVTPAQLVGKVKRLGLLPALKGVQVSFVGVGGGVSSTQRQLNEEYEAHVKQFWKSVVVGGGGSLCFYSVESSELPRQC